MDYFKCWRRRRDYDYYDEEEWDGRIEGRNEGEDS